MAEVRTLTVPRSELIGVFKTQRLVKFVEDLTDDVKNTLPGVDAEQDAKIQTAQETADAAGELAATAKTRADEAFEDAGEAQDDIDSTQALEFVVVTSNALIPNASVLQVGPGLVLDTSTPGVVSINRQETINILGADFVESAGSFAATGLEVPVEADSTYLFDGLLSFESAATTTGIGFSFSLPAGATIVGSYFHNVTTTSVEGSYNIATVTVKGNTSSVQQANQKIPVVGRWLVKTAGTAGVCALNVRTEVAASAVTVHQGSVVISQKVA